MNHFPFGVGYYQISRSLPPDWASDLLRMEQVGIDEINVHAVWRFMEPTRGEFDFSVTDTIMRAARERGMTVVFSLHPLPDPRWFHERYAGVGMVDRRQRPAYPRNRVALCWDNPHFREHCAKFIRAVVVRYKDHPALTHWNVWTEPNWIGGSPVYPPVDYDMVTCYCEHTAAEWSQWLKQRYGTPEAVSATWRVGYGGGDYYSWDQITPPDAIPGQWGSYRAWLDWRGFMDDRLADLVGWVSRNVSDVDPVHPTQSNLLFQAAIYNPTILGCDCFKMAREVAILGASVYARSTVAGSHPELLAQTVDVLRSAAALTGGSCWVTEYQGGPVIWSHDRACVPSAQDLFVAPFQAIAHGAKGFYYWMWRARTDAENGGWEQAEYGMVGMDGTLRDRARRAGDASRVIRAHEAALMASEYRPTVAILRSQKLYHIAFGEVRDEGGSKREVPHGDARRFYTDSVLGAYRALWEENIPVGFVTPTDIEQGSLKNYRVLVLPFTYMLEAGAAAKIDEFVRSGGIAIADFGCAMKDESGAVYERAPGAGLLTTFGAELWDMASDEMPFAAQAGPPVVGRHNGWQLPTHQLRAILRPDHTSDVVGHFADGAAAVTVHKHGDGIAVLVGTLLFQAFQATSDPEIKGFLRALASLKGPVSRVEVLQAEAAPHIAVEACLLDGGDGGDGNLLIVINHGDRAASAKIVVREAVTGGEDWISGRRLKAVPVADGSAFDLALAQNNAVLIHLEHRDT